MRRLSEPALLRWPSQCEICRQWGHAPLCGDCVARFAAPLPRCQRCGIRVGSAATAVCGPCLVEPPPLARTVCAADYGFPWDRLVADLKFRQRPELADALALRMLVAVQGAGPPWPDALVPVPLAPQRLAQRGYNQAWELARRLAARLRLQADARCLLRPLDTAQQAELGRAERLRNLRTAFMVEPRRQAALRGLHLALVDDVMTTGATAHQAATELLRAGAARVDLWVLARTPAPADAGLLPIGHLA